MFFIQQKQCKRENRKTICEWHCNMDITKPKAAGLRKEALLLRQYCFYFAIDDKGSLYGYAKVTKDLTEQKKKIEGALNK